MFMEEIAKNLNNENFAEMIDLEKFKKCEYDLKKISSNSWLRKIYDTYLDIYNKDNYDIEKQIWIARIAYQEKRKLLPWGFAQFVKEIDKNLKKENFKKFMEVLVAYHKYFNPTAK